MPTLSIYVNDEIYAYLMKQSRDNKPSATAKKWIEDRYKKETEAKKEDEG